MGLTVHLLRCRQCLIDFEWRYLQEKKDDAKNKDNAKEEKDNKVVATDDEEEIKVLTKFSSGGFSKG